MLCRAATGETERRHHSRSALRLVPAGGQTRAHSAKWIGSQVKETRTAGERHEREVGEERKPPPPPLKSVQALKRLAK